MRIFLAIVIALSGIVFSPKLSEAKRHPKKHIVHVKKTKGKHHTRKGKNHTGRVPKSELDRSVKSKIIVHKPEEEAIKRDYPLPGSEGEDRNFDWYRKRAFPNEDIEPSAYPNALAEARRLPVYRLDNRKSFTQASTDWQCIGPFKIGGRVTALATHPTDSNTFYVGAAAGGLWKTTDHGTSWQSLTDTFSAISVGCITIDPHNSNTIYIGMGECNGSADSYPGNGLWRSTDAGASWKLLGLEKTQYVSKIIVSPASKDTIYVCVPGPNTTADSNRGIWMSVDYGATWQRSLLVRSGTGKNSPPVAANDLAMNPTDPHDLVAAMWQKFTSLTTTTNLPYNGLWRTRDGGQTWKRIDTLPGIGYINGKTFKRQSRTSLCWVNTPGKPTLYSLASKTDKDPVTGYALADNFCALFKTTDPEVSWTTVLDSTYRLPFLGNNIDSVDFFNKQGSYNNVIIANPKRPDEIVIGGIDVLKTSDGGAHWTNISNAYPHYFANDRSQHSDQHALAFTAASSGNDLLNGQDGGVFNTTDYGAHWVQMKGLPITMFYHLEPWAAGMASLPASFPADSLKVFGGTQDNGSVGKGFSANTDWDWINRGDGGFAQADPNNKNHIITNIQLGKIYFRNTLDSLRPNLFSDNGKNDPNTKKWFDLSVIARRRGITDSSEACGFIPPVFLDKQNGVDLYTGRTAIYKATLSFSDPDSATVIRKWSPQLTGKPNDPKAWYYGNIEAIGLGIRDEKNRPMLWAAGILNGNRVLWRTTYNPSLSIDSVPTWVRADSSGLPGLTPAWIECDRTDSLTAFIGFSGFNAGGHLYKTTNAKKWVSISGNLPNAPIDAFVIDSLAEHGDPLKKNQCLIVAMDVGVFVTTNGGANWSQLGTGMPNLVVGSLTMYKNWLIAGTHGRSAWALDISDLNAEQINSVARSGAPLQALSIYPNPASHSFKLQLDKTSASACDIELFDINGKHLFMERIQDISAEIMLPASVQNGTYVVRVSDEKGIVAEGKLQIVR